MLRWRYGVCLLVGLLWWLGGTQAEDDGAEEDGVDSVVSLLEFVIDVDSSTAAECLKTLTEKVASGELNNQQLQRLRERLRPKLEPILKDRQPADVFEQSQLLAASWGDPHAVQQMLSLVERDQGDVSRRAAALRCLAAVQNPTLLQTLPRLIRARMASEEEVAPLLDAMARFNDESVPTTLLEMYGQLPESIRPRTVEVLLQRPSWSIALLQAIGDGRVPPEALHVNQVTRLLASKDEAVAELVEKHWGKVRLERNPQRVEVIREMQQFLGDARGSVPRGRIVYQRLCGQCHQIHGEGHVVGPDITRNGRGTFDQLVANVFDPSLVIGAAYQARTVVTIDGRVLTGLAAEDNERRIVLKMQGGKQEVIPRDEVDEVVVSQLSLMPEGVEKQLTRQEIADLFAFLAIENDSRKEAPVLISGTPQQLVQLAQ